MSELEHRPPAHDRALYARVGWVLLGGLLFSIAVMAVGFGAALVHGTTSTAVLPLDRVPAELANGNPEAILDLGILLLFATPLAGVITAFSEFLRQGDRTFALVSAGVLVLVAVGIVVALH